MTLTDIWPYVLVILGMFVEGEFSLLATTIAVAHDLLNLPIALLCAFIGTFAADMTHFYIGRWKGRDWILSKEKWRKKADILEKRLESNPFKIFLGIRFMYGFRIVAPMIVGVTGMSTRRYMIYTATTIVIWIAVYTTMGLLFGNWIEAHLSELKHAEKYVIGAVIVMGLCFYFIRRRILRIRSKRND